MDSKTQESFDEIMKDPDNKNCFECGKIMNHSSLITKF